MSWNVVLNKFIEIKNRYIKEFGESNLWDYHDVSCLEYWVEKLDDDGLRKLIAPLQLNEFNNMLLIRYGMFSNATDGESEVNYMSFWDMYDGFYMECRSLVIDIINEKIVLCPFRKFRNMNECEETKEENIAERIKHASCVEFTNKLDGSMQSARWYDGRIVMSGSQSLNPELSFRLADGYHMLLSHQNYVDFLKDYCGYTAIFEYISLKDQHIVKYNSEDEGLYLIGLRNVNTGTELNYTDVIGLAEKYGLRTTNKFDTCLNDVIGSLDDKKSDEAEGFVINIDGFKVKVKYNDYVNMHRVLSAISSTNLVIKSIADGTYDDLFSKVPDAYKERVTQTADKVYHYINLKQQDVMTWYNALVNCNLKTVKDVMLWIEKNVPKDLKYYVKEKYLGRKLNFIKSGSGKYKKMREIESQCH